MTNKIQTNFSGKSSFVSVQEINKPHGIVKPSNAINQQLFVDRLNFFL